AVSPGQESAAPGTRDLDAREAAGAEHERKLRARVVEDRAISDQLVADLPDRSLDERPSRKRADDAPALRAELEHPGSEQVRVRQVVEQPQRQDHIERPFDRGSHEVSDLQLCPRPEALETR